MIDSEEAGKDSSVWALFYVALLVRLLYLGALVGPGPLRLLPYNLDLRAVTLRAGEKLNYPDAWASFHVVLASFYWLLDVVGLLGQRALFVALLQSVMAAVAIAVFYLLSKQLFASEAATLASTATFGLYYPFMYFNTLVLSETTFVLAVVVALYLLVTVRRSVLTLGVAGLLLGVGLISRPILTPFLPLMIIWLVLTDEGRGRIVHAFAVLVPLVGVVLIASYVNMQMDSHGRFSYNGNTGVNFAMAQCRIRTLRYDLPGGEYAWFSSPSFQDTSNPEIYTDVPFYDNRFYLQMGLDCLRDNPLRLVTNMKHVANIYDSSFYPNFNQSPAHLVAVKFWKIPAVLLTLSFFAYPLLARRAGDGQQFALRNYWLFAALLVSLFASVYLASPGEERYLATHFFLLPLYGIPALMLLLHRVGLAKPSV